MQPKDWVTLTTASIGCVLAMVSFIRTLLLERRLLLEPYFKARWQNLHEIISGHLDSTQSWMFAIQSHSNDPTSFLPIMHHRQAIKLDADVRKYSRQLSRSVDEYKKIVAQLETEVTIYNALIDPITSSFGLSMMLRDPEESKEERQELSNRVESARKIMEEYLGSDAKNTIKDLSDNANYKRDISAIRRNVQKSVTKLEAAHKELSRLVKLYSARFE